MEGSCSSGNSASNVEPITCVILPVAGMCAASSLVKNLRGPSRNPRAGDCTDPAGGGKQARATALVLRLHEFPHDAEGFRRLREEEEMVAVQLTRDERRHSDSLPGDDVAHGGDREPVVPGAVEHKD